MCVGGVRSNSPKFGPGIPIVLYNVMHASLAAGNVEAACRIFTPHPYCGGFATCVASGLPASAFVDCGGSARRRPCLVRWRRFQCFAAECRPSPTVGEECSACRHHQRQRSSTEANQLHMAEHSDSAPTFNARALES